MLLPMIVDSLPRAAKMPPPPSTGGTSHLHVLPVILLSTMVIVPSLYTPAPPPKLPRNSEVLALTINGGEHLEHVPRSAQADGHQVLSVEPQEGSESYRVLIRKGEAT